MGTHGTAFGVADDTVMTILDIVLATNERTTDGLLYDLGLTDIGSVRIVIACADEHVVSVDGDR